MKTTLITLFILIVSFNIILFILGIISRSGKASGLVEGRLSGCPNKPNCVCSEYKDDVSHYIDPIIIPQNITFDTWPILKSAIQDMGGSFQAESDNYLASTFSSAVFGFVDDLEIRLDSTQNVIHIRSSSRVGFSDAGINKKRAALFKELYNKKISEAVQSLNVKPKNGAH